VEPVAVQIAARHKSPQTTDSHGLVRLRKVLYRTPVGVYKEKNMYGKKVMGIERTTFVISPDGKIEKIYHKVKAKGHAAEVLEGL
jgi:peroxiredoxin